MTLGQKIQEKIVKSGTFFTKVGQYHHHCKVKLLQHTNNFKRIPHQTTCAGWMMNKKFISTKFEQSMF